MKGAGKNRGRCHLATPLNTPLVTRNIPGFFLIYPLKLMLHSYSFSSFSCYHNALAAVEGKGCGGGGGEEVKGKKKGEEGGRVGGR